MKKLLLFAILCVSISDLNAQNLASTVQKIKELHNVTYTDILKFKISYQDEPSVDTLKVQVVASASEPQIGGYYKIADKTDVFLFDGDKTINLNLIDTTYKISKNATLSQLTRNLLYWRKEMEKYLKTPSRIKLRKDTLINKVIYYQFLVKSLDTIIKNKHVYSFVNIIINKKTNLPYMLKRYDNALMDDGALMGFTEEHTFKSYLINKPNFPDLSNAVTPANFKLPVNKKKLPMFTNGVQPPKINLYDAAGNNFDLEKLKGKIVLLSFTTLGCPHAFNSVQMLTKLNKEYKNSEFAVISIYQLGSNDKKAIAKFTNKMNIKYPSYTTESTAEDIYHLQGYPDFYLLDKQGIIAQGYDGFYAGLEKEIKDKIESLK
jgi:cytochrome oxidase Cu insertion factor (SCO1/SenC/PrrC family)